MKIIRFISQGQVIIFLALCLCSNYGFAETITEVSPPTKSISPFTNWPIVLLVLIGMIGFILALSWFVKRFGGLNFTGSREMKVVTSISLGARERVALVDVKGQQFLLGVTTQNISHLHSFDEAVIPLEEVDNGLKQSDFISKFQAVLNATKKEQTSDSVHKVNVKDGNNVS